MDLDSENGSERAFRLRRRRLPDISRLHLYGRPAWWLRTAGWVALGVPLGIVDLRLVPIGPLLFEVGFYTLAWRQYRRQRWRGVSGEAAFLASRGVDVETAVPEVIRAAGNRRRPIEQALEAMLEYPKTASNERAVQILRESLAQLD